MADADEMSEFVCNMKEKIESIKIPLPACLSCLLLTSSIQNKLIGCENIITDHPLLILQDDSPNSPNLFVLTLWR